MEPVCEAISLFVDVLEISERSGATVVIASPEARPTTILSINSSGEASQWLGWNTYLPARTTSQCGAANIITLPRTFNIPVTLILPVSCSLRATAELMMDPANPPKVNTAVAAEYRVESNPRQSGNAAREEERTVLHVMDDSGKFSSEMW
jgi:hypothetical protein